MLFEMILSQRGYDNVSLNKKYPYEWNAYNWR